MAAITEVRQACAGFIHLPTEDELFAGLNHMAKALLAAVVPGGAANDAGTGQAAA